MIKANDKKTTEIDGSRWNKLGLYSFVKVNKDSVSGNLNETSIDLMIPPQSISIQTQFANSIIATNNGFLEENSGTVFRTINISGTTGILPTRKQAVSEKPESNFFSAVFPETGGAIKKLTSTFNSFASNLKSFFNADKDEASVLQGSGVNESDTGYYQFWKLYNFFVEYTEAKKDPSNKNMYLVFRNTKDNLDFAVTPINFDLRRDSRNPLLYNYSITLRAWSVTNSEFKEGDFNKGVDIRNPSFVKGILETIRKGRKTIQEAEGSLRGIQSDIGDIIDVVAQAHMASKDAVGLGATLLDMPNVLKNNTAAIWEYNNSQMEGALATYGKARDGLNAAFVKARDDFYKSVGIKTGEKKTTAAANAAGISNTTETTSSNTTETSAPNTNPSGEKPDPTSPSGLSTIADEIVKELLSNGDALDSLNISDLNLPPDLAKEVANKIAEAKTTTSGEVEQAARRLQKLSDNMTFQSNSLVEDDIIVLAQIQDTVNSLIALTVSQDKFKEKRPDNFKESNKVSAEENKMPTPSSGYPIIVNRGDTLEKIAKNYLGDPDRYREIAALNNLSLPYIDEKGFTLNINQCNLRKFIVSDSKKLNIGQKIVIYANGMAPSRRVIYNIQKVDDVITVTVSGASDLSKYTADVKPYIFARASGTVGPGDTILIPSPAEADQGEEPRSTSLLDKMSYAEKVFMVDVALNEFGNDLKIEPSGDVARSYGYTNAIQAIRLAIETEKGALQRHPNYGLPDIVGSLNSVISKKDIEDLIKKRIVADPRFKSAKVYVQTEGSVVKIRVEAYGSHGTGLIPIEFQVSI